MRYLKVSLLLGVIICLILAALYEAGAFLRLDLGLWSFLGRVSNPPCPHALVQYFAFTALAFGLVPALYSARTESSPSRRSRRSSRSRGS